MGCAKASVRYPRGASGAQKLPRYATWGTPGVQKIPRGTKKSQGHKKYLGAQKFPRGTKKCPGAQKMPRGTKNSQGHKKFPGAPPGAQKRPRATLRELQVCKKFTGALQEHTHVEIYSMLHHMAA